MNELTVTKDMGKSLLDAAREKNRKELTDKCVGEVQGLFSLIAASENTIEAENRKVAICQEKLAAIEAGEISVSPAGAIRYNKGSLNVPLNQAIYQGIRTE